MFGRTWCAPSRNAVWWLKSTIAFLEGAHHVRPNILQVIHGRNRKVAFLISRLVTEIGSQVIAGIPRSLFRIDKIKTIVVALIKANVVENVELDFGSPIARVRDAGGLKVLLGLARNVAWIASVFLAG